MPFEFADPGHPDLEVAALHGIPRERLVAYIVERLPPSQRRGAPSITFEDGGSFVNMGMNFRSVRWQAAWGAPTHAVLDGRIALHNGEIAGWAPGRRIGS